MHLHPLAARLATIVFAFGLFSASVVFAHYALADGIERSHRHQPASREAFAPPREMPTAPDVPQLLGSATTTSQPFEGASAAASSLPVSAPAVSGPCLGSEDTYGIIADTTKGENIDAINTALDELVQNPAGPPVGQIESPLAGRLRAALGMTSSAPPCTSVQNALRDALQLSEIASTAGPNGPTGGVNQYHPYSPVLYVPPGTPSGPGGFGY